MDNITLSAAELHLLKTLVLLKNESQQQSHMYRDIDLVSLYGKLNVLWSEARREERDKQRA